MNLRDTPPPGATGARCAIDTGSMARRRQHGSLKDPVAVTYRIERDARDQLRDVAVRSGVSCAELLETLIARIDLDADGLPVWADEMASRRNRVKELPIDKAA